MVKGFVSFRDGKIPFVIEDCRMELFTDDSLLGDFAKEYNFKKNYILQGQCLANGFQGQKATFLVEQSIGNTCYLRCFIINRLTAQDEYDTTGFQSPFLDDVFRYRYNYLDNDKALITFNYKDGTKAISFDEIKENTGSDLDCLGAPYYLPSIDTKAFAGRWFLFCLKCLETKGF
jgi:hypothetical protein